MTVFDFLPPPDLSFPRLSFNERELKQDLFTIRLKQ